MASSRQAAAELAADVRRIFGDRLRTVALYGSHARGEESGPIRCLCLITSLQPTDLDACAAETARWHGLGLATPLLVPVAEFEQSLDAFPLEYGDIVDHHVQIEGEDLLATVQVDPDDLRRACETQVKSHLLHLRQHYLDARGNPGAIATLLTQAAPAFAALLERVAALHGSASDDRAAACRAGARVAGLSESTVAAVLALAHQGSLTAPDGARLFPEYLAAVEQLAAVVNTWQR